MKISYRTSLLIGAVSVLSLGWISVSAAGSAPADEMSNADDPKLAVETRFSETQVDEVNCHGFGPLCEVVAGKTVFYVDPEARHAFIGRVFDLDQKADLTEATLQRLGPQPNLVEAGAATSVTYTSAWESLPFDAAIVRNEGGARKVAVFSDLNCGYCRNLSFALDDAPDIEVHEFLVGQMGSAEASNAIGCAENPAKAIAAYFRTRSMPDQPCERDIVQPAQQAARAIQMQGTPTFVREDGAITSGFRDLATLRAWIDEASPNDQSQETSE